MVARRVNNEGPSKPKRRPATTPEAREAQLVSLAVDLAEKQLREGTASSQVMSHYLKLGSSREKLEQERLENENNLLKGKLEALDDAKNMAELYVAAMDAMRSYSGNEPLELEADYDD